MPDVSIFQLLADAGRALGVLLIGVLGVVAFAASLRTARQAVTLARAPTTRTVDLEPGLVTVAGDVRVEEPLTAPISGEPCVGYVLREWTSHVPEGGVNDTALSISGLEWWEDDSTREQSIAAVVPFYLRDDGGEVAIDPRSGGEPARSRGPTTELDPLSNFDLTDPPRTEVESGDGALPGELLHVVERHPDLGRDVARRRYVEERVPASGLTVSGRAIRDGGRVTVVNEGSAFVLSDTAVSATIRDRLAVAAVLVLFGVGALALGAFGLRTWFGVSIAF